jgi:hypothetical protein
MDLHAAQLISSEKALRFLSARGFKSPWRANSTLVGEIVEN